ncbi:hypothetical protein BYT27DRAFT_7249471 [Phlegmacium glaucopus]|nr:hypothetical protein BYT27DRAFT_7249471 [Phlegmacium glaucopus]
MERSCLVQFVSGAGFGNCVVVSQEATATGTGNSTTSKTSGSCSAKSAAKKAGKMDAATAPAVS